MLEITSLLTSAVLLSDCAMGTSNHCAPLYTYSEAEQLQAANELEALPDDSVLPKLIGDYAKIREGARECRNIL